MALSLAKDKLYYSSSQLKDLSNAVRQGDLTPILRIYEEDIRTPVKSAVTGTLLRSLFIQVQKAKVGISWVYRDGLLTIGSGGYRSSALGD